MKKILMIAMAFVAMSLVSCTQDAESKAKDYVEQSIEALKSGDLKKVEELSKAVEEYTNSLSEEDKKVFVEAMQKFSEEHKDELAKALESSMKGMLEQFGNGKANVNAENLSEDLEDVVGDVEDIAKSVGEVSKSVGNMVNSISGKE